MTSPNAALIYPTARLTRTTLPPLILHPFADANGPGKLMESSKASLMLQGLLPTGDRDQRDLNRILIDGRYQEVRMLFYVGRDLNRWIEQCMEHVDRQPELRSSGIKAQSFAAHLIEQPPASVAAKLEKWGVKDFRAIFRRAIGLNAILADVPPLEMLSEDFIRSYDRFADQMYLCSQNRSVFAKLDSMAFDYEIYASGEYSRMLEQQWA
ncbi:MAG: hypothetical protein ABI824_01890 [Acidobacteriota bacterium]